jgi:hypothetical protein
MPYLLITDPVKPLNLEPKRSNYRVYLEDAANSSIDMREAARRFQVNYGSLMLALRAAGLPISQPGYPKPIRERFAQIIADVRKRSRARSSQRVCPLCRGIGKVNTSLVTTIKGAPECDLPENAIPSNGSTTPSSAPQSEPG